MKRLLASDYSQIFQICKCFRKGERGDLHLPEFTLLEWYHSKKDYYWLMEECEDLFIHISTVLGQGEKVTYKGKKIDLLKPWDRLTVKDAFGKYATIDVETAIKKDCFDEVLVQEIESHLGLKKPIFLYDYPSSMAALSRLKKEGDVAERFELYIGGLELTNGFSELTDTQEQRKRLSQEQEERKKQGKITYPMPEKFLKSLNCMPDSAGIALGLDRLIMFFTDQDRIDEIVTFTPEDL